MDEDHLAVYSLVITRTPNAAATIWATDLCGQSPAGRVLAAKAVVISGVLYVTAMVFGLIGYGIGTLLVSSELRHG